MIFAPFMGRKLIFEVENAVHHEALVDPAFTNLFPQSLYTILNALNKMLTCKILHLFIIGVCLSMNGRL